MRRRRFVAWGCACGGALALPVRAQAPAWEMPERLGRPELASDEGGLWAMMDREETRLRRSPLVLREHGLRDYLQGLTCKLAGGHCPDVRVYAVRTPWFNASMAPNGMMQVWTGLLLRVDNEAQLAAVLGHEIGHYVQRHSLERLRDARSRSAANVAFALLGGAGLIAQIANMAGMAQYSREHETAADSIGLQLMHRAGYDTGEAAKVWKQLRAELTAGAGGDPAKKSVLFASHPPSDERERALSEGAAAMPSSGERGEAALEQALAPFMTDLLEDELKRGQHDETLVLLDRLHNRSPLRPDFLHYRGETRRLRGRDGDLELAMADLHAAIALPEPPAATHRSLGFIARQRGDRVAARESLQRYLELAPAATDAALIRSYIDDLESNAL